MFCPTISPNKVVDYYHKCCKHALIKHKPRTGMRNASCGGDNEDKTKIMNLWEDYVKSVISLRRNHPDSMQTEMNTCLLNRQLETHETGDIIVHDHVINDVDEADGCEHNDD